MTNAKHKLCHSQAISTANNSSQTFSLHSNDKPYTQTLSFRRNLKH